ncbi:hypothetical protein [Limnobacter sp. P1]|uniref:hypothetical protein n=1 Tax=Limnobacter olei TaxID=3031298 RepID=UPI0023B0D382|nr:hypothetical protein [Limnobacter sp. P1]
MQSPIGNLHAQLQHSTAVLDGFISDVQTLKKESSALTKSVDSLAKDYLKQCRRFATPASVANPVIQNLENLQACSSLVYDQADNLKGCLDAVVKNSYKPDLKRADQGKRTKILVQAEQEAATFETHIRLAESLVATVLPRHQAPACHNALPRDYQQLGDLNSAYLAVQGSIPTGIQTPLLGQLRVGTLTAAAMHLRDQIEAPNVRHRVPPLSLPLPLNQ